MVTQNVGRLAVVSPDDPRHLLGVITRSDVLSSYRRKLADMQVSESILRRGLKRRGKAGAAAVPPAPPPSPAIIPEPPKPQAMPESNPSTP
jgi:predicted transcriptional regulator